MYNGDEEPGYDEDWARINQPEVRKRVQNRLSQRRHRAKVRQQREPVSQEVILPPTFTSSYGIDGAAGPSDYPNPSLTFNSQDQRHNLSRPNQPQEGYDAFDGFNSQDLLPPDQTLSNAMTQPAQAGASALSRSMTPHMGRPTINTSFQSPNMPLASLASPHPSHAAEPSSEYWNSHPLSDTQWTLPSFHQNSAPVSNPAGSTNTPRPMSRNTPRPVCRPTPIRFSNSFPDQQQISAPRTPTRASEMQPSPPGHNHISDHAYPRSSSHLDTGSTESSARENHGPCSHCRSCRASGAFTDNRTGHASPKTPTSTPPRGSSQMSSSDNLEILSNCSLALAKLARQSDYHEEREPGQRQRNRRRKSSRSSVEEYSLGSDRNSQEDDYGEGLRQQGVDKVVIVYVQNGRVSK